MNRSFETPVKPNELKVAVLMGGISREREVSIESGRCVAEALKQAGVNVVVADVKPDELDVLEDGSIDAFFIALHGRFGEDGVLQEILESKGLIYTGSGPQASKLAFDKWASKERFAAAGATTPEAILFEPGARLGEGAIAAKEGTETPSRSRARGAEFLEQLRRLGKKYVIKPIREGSTIGVSIVDEPRAAVAAAEGCAAEFGDCMIEEFIAGREITVGILGKEALPIIEIRPRAGFYDYHAKYLDDQTEYLFDTIDNPALVAGIQKSAIDCFDALGCRGAARVDFILGGDDRPYVLEINTIPGMMSHSLLPKAADRVGLSMSRLCMRIVELALSGAATGKTAIRPRPLARSRSPRLRRSKPGLRRRQ